jgi:putative SOS response-associated peptidase YedK
MCNRYATDLRKAPDWVRRLHGFDEVSDTPRDIYPDVLAPVIRMGVDSQPVIGEMRWGFPPPPNLGRAPVTNVRNLASPYWRGWLKADFRCLVPFAAFSEYEDASPKGAKVLRWFDVPAAPTAFFAGIWRPWTGERGTKAERALAGTREHLLFSFLTTEANDVVRPVHAKAMPVVLVTEEECRDWLSAPVEAAIAMARPLGNDRLRLREAA